VGSNPMPWPPSNSHSGAMRSAPGSVQRHRPERVPGDEGSSKANVTDLPSFHSLGFIIQRLHVWKIGYNLQIAISMRKWWHFVCISGYLIFGNIHVSAGVESESHMIMFPIFLLDSIAIHWYRFATKSYTNQSVAGHTYKEQNMKKWCSQLYSYTAKQAIYNLILVVVVI
jgi:hypothetical protein